MMLLASQGSWAELAALCSGSVRIRPPAGSDERTVHGAFGRVTRSVTGGGTPGVRLSRVCPAVVIPIAGAAALPAHRHPIVPGL